MKPPNCVRCIQPILFDDKTFAEDPKAHPLIEGLIHRRCYTAIEEAAKLEAAREAMLEEKGDGELDEELEAEWEERGDLEDDYEWGI